MPSKHSEFGDASYLIFLVDDTLFQIPLRHLRQSQFFRDMINEVHTGSEGEGKSDELPIYLSGISAFEMESFLRAIDSPFIYGDPRLTFSQWASALHLATMWNFDEIRERVISQMDKMISTADVFERIDASLKCRVEKWLHPAYETLCTRSETLSDSEAERLGFRRAAAIWRIRERFLSDQIPWTAYNRRFSRRKEPEPDDQPRKEDPKQSAYYQEPEKEPEKEPEPDEPKQSTYYQEPEKEPEGLYYDDPHPSNSR